MDCVYYFIESFMDFHWVKNILIEYYYTKTYG